MGGSGSILSAMRLARILGAIGRGLISAGVIVLLFVGYQLWGTGWQASAAQNNLGNEFEAQTGMQIASDAESMAAAARSNQEAIALNPNALLTQVPSLDGDGDGTQADVVGANFDEATRQAILAQLYPDEGKPLARIVIPDINVDWIVVEGVSVEDLRKGPGHYTTTPNPGQAGNAAIAGHRTTYGAPFHRVDELEPGDQIFVTTAQGVFEYRVIGFDETRRRGGDLGYFIVDPSETQVLDQGDENILTLTACHPKYSARQRIIVQAELVGEPVPTIPRAEAAGLGTVTLDSGASDESASDTGAVAGDDTIPSEEQVIIGDDVAADDDPTVDANGNPIGPAEVAMAGDGSAAGAEGGDRSDNAVDDVELDAGDAELVSAESDNSTDDFGEGLNGDPTKVQPAVMWGLSGLFIWIASWFMGKQFGRKWTLYAVGLVPFGLVLWSTFVNVDQALPSY